MANIYRKISIHGLTDLLADRFMDRRTRSGKSMAESKFMNDDSRGYAGGKKTHRDLLRAATTYANFADTQDAYTHKARRDGVTAYSIALSDWFGAPRLLEIDVDKWTGEIGQTIRVKARDNVLVAGVSVVIRDADENILEMGEAMPSHTGSAWWTYTTRTRVKMNPFPGVEAIARDLPGNRDSFVVS
jgi:hypothetical protein